MSTRVGHSTSDPVILLGQLSVDESWQGRYLGTDLLIDAVRRAHAAASVIGARAVVVQAINEDADSPDLQP